INSSMKFAILTFLTALFLAGIAAWFSILGIQAIFSGAAIAALVMGVGIEIGKLVGVSWLYRNWGTWNSGPWIKWPLLVMTFVAMMLTSIGIFGFLSKAHLDQNAPASDNYAKVELIDSKISQYKQTIEQEQSK